MLLDSNTKKVINLLDMFNKLSNTDKIRLAIYIMENKNFYTNFNIKDIIIILKEILKKLDSNYGRIFVNFAKYEHLLLFSAKYLELNLEEKKKFTIEMLFNIYETDFANKSINEIINNQLYVYDYCYVVLNK